MSHKQINTLWPLLVLVVLLSIGLLQLARGESCDNEKCGWGATCKMIKNRPRCKCNEFCPMVHEPICGSDGKTYTNYCGMKQAGCHQQEELVKVHDGPCPKVVAAGDEPDDSGDDSDRNANDEIRPPEDLKNGKQPTMKP